MTTVPLYRHQSAEMTTRLRNQECLTSFLDAAALLLFD